MFILSTLSIYYAFFFGEIVGTTFLPFSSTFIQDQARNNLYFFLVLEFFHAYPRTCVRTLEAPNLVQLILKLRVFSGSRGF